MSDRSSSTADAADESRLDSMKDVLVLLAGAQGAQVRNNPSLLQKWGRDPAVHSLIGYRRKYVRQVASRAVSNGTAPEDLPSAVLRAIVFTKRTLPSSVLDGRDERFTEAQPSRPADGDLHRRIGTTHVE